MNLSQGRIRTSLIYLISAAAGITCPFVAHAIRNYTPHAGYVAEIEDERDIQFTDMIVIKPPNRDQPTLRDRIFDDKLSKEFRERYEERFGRTEVERSYYSQNKFTYIDDLYGFRGTPQEMSNERRRFGDFMVRRLAEHHLDNYAKNDPNVRPVWEAKERLSNVRVEVNRLKFDINYSIAGNTLDLKVGNPWFSTTKVRLQMDPAAFGPGQINETILSLGRAVTRKITVESHWHVTDGIVSVVGRRSITPALSSSLSSSTFTKNEGPSRRESLYLAGVSYSF